MWINTSGSASGSPNDSSYVLGISPGSTRSETYTYTIPSGTSPGTYYAVIKVDKDGEVSESNENNNVETKSFEVVMGVIESAYWWAPLEITEGMTATMCAKVTGFEVGTIANFEVIEDDPWPNPDTRNVANLTGVVFYSDVPGAEGYYVKAEWPAVWIDDGLGQGDPEYFFQVTIGTVSKYSSEALDGEMVVSKADWPIKSQEIGDAIYRELKILDWSVWHAAVYLCYSGTNPQKTKPDDYTHHHVMQAGSLGDPHIDCTEFNNFQGFLGEWDYPTDYFGAYSPPGLSKTQRNQIIHKAIALEDEVIPYSAQGWPPDWWYDCVLFDSGTTKEDRRDPSSIVQIRCDGVVEWCYESLDIKVWGPEGNYWNILEYPGEHNRLYAPWWTGDFPNPDRDFAPKVQSGRVGAYSTMQPSTPSPPETVGIIKPAEGSTQSGIIDIWIFADDEASGVHSYHDDHVGYVEIEVYDGDQWQPAVRVWSETNGYFRTTYDASHVIGPVTGKVRVLACDRAGNINDTWVDEHTFIIGSESISTPTSVSGSSSTYVGKSESYAASGASSNLGHSVQYRFNWGDGNTSDWGSATQNHSWSSSGTFNIKAQARCATHTDKVSGWSGTLKSVTASYLTLSTSVNPSGAGSVTKNPDKSWYSYGEAVQVTANANSGYIFSHWSGDASGTSNPTSVTMSSNKSVTANFSGGTISGRVTLGDGTGLAGVRLQVSSGAPEYDAYTDADGYYEITGILHEWSLAYLTAHKEGYTFTPSSYTVDTRGYPAITAKDFTAYEVNRPPVAEAGGPYTGNEGSAVTFDGNGSSDPDGDVLEYRWDFDSDGAYETSWSTTPTASHTWYDDHTGTVTLEVRDPDDLRHTDTASVTVENVDPTASASNDGPAGEGSQVTVTASQTDPGTEDTFTYSFDWNNDGVWDVVDQLTPSASHTYMDDGMYTVRVRVRDHDGGEGTATTDVVVNDVGPVAQVTGDTELDEGSEGSFDAGGSSSYPDDIVSYEWDWEYDGAMFDAEENTGTTPTASHTWSDDGSYTMAVRVTDEDGSIDIAALGVVVSNVDPVITSTAVTTATEELQYEYEVEATDPGSEDTLSYSLDTAPDGMSIDGDTGLITWTPTNEQAAQSHEVVVRVTDDDEGYDTQSFSVAVENTNDIPIIITTAILEAIEEALYQYDVEASDDDLLNPSGEVLTFSLDTAPTGMVIDSATGLIIWTPTNEQAAQSHDVVVRVTDKAGATVSQSYAIEVANVNDEPVITSTAILEATEELLYEYDVEASDDDLLNPSGEVLTFSLDTAPSGMDIDSATGLITWAPTNEQAAQSHDVIVRVTDSAEATVTQSYSIEVANVNDGPVITSTAILEATEEVLYEYDVEASDDDLLNPSGEVLTFSLDTSPAGMTIDSAIGLITWTPTNEQAAQSHDVVVRVTDSADAYDTQSYTITVENVNDEPEITTPAVTEATEEVLYSYDVESDDDDFHTMNPTEVHSYSLDTAPTGMDIDSATGLITWTPTNEQAAQSHDVVVRVTDKAGATVAQSYAIQVANVNDEPVITSAAILEATEEVLYEYDVEASDDDLLNPSGEVLTFSLDTSPAGMSIDSATGVISWTPTNEQSEGTHEIVVRVTDVAAAYDTQSYVMTVANVNDEPEIASLPVTEATEEALYSYDVASDDDDFRTMNPTEVHTYSLDTAPDGMAIDSATGLITWTPTNEQSEGSHEIVVRVTDVAGAYDTQAYTITVENVNDEPQITTEPVTEATEEVLYSYDVTSDDDDFRTMNPTEVHTYSLDASPSGMVIDSATGVITWTPTNEQAAQSHDVVVRATDKGEATVSQSYSIEVVNVNDEPVIRSTPMLEATEEVLYQYDVEASDDDVLNPSGEVLTFSLDTAPTGMVIDSATGVITWTPTNEQAAQSHDVLVRVTDSAEATVSQSYSIEVANVNDAPSITSAAILEATEELLYQYDVEASDDDLLNPSGEVLTFGLDTSPTGMAVDSATGLITWTPTNEQSEGSHEIVVRVTDVAGAYDMQSYTITVANVNDDPEITSLAVTEATEEVLYSYDVESDDDDFWTINPTEVHTYSVDTAPAGMSIDSATGLISWTPTNEQAAQSHDVVVRVTDSAEATVTQSYSIEVANVNDAPIITSTAIFESTEELLYQYDVEASDDDLLNPSGEVLTFSLDTAPVGMSIDSATGLISWTPTNEQAAQSHDVVVRVTDKAGATVSQSYSIEVANVNDAPVITSTAILEATEEVLYEYDVEASDDDLLNPSGEALTFSLDTSPAGMTIDSATGVITWMPTNEQSEGSHEIVVRVTDVASAYDTQSYVIAVANVNDEPEITTSAVTEAIEEVLYTYDVESDDDDFRTMNPTEVHTYSLDTAPTGMSIDSATGLITWTPTNEQAAQSYDVVVRVTDIAGATTTQSYELWVENVNDPPVADAGLDQTVFEGEEVTFDGSGTTDDDLLNPWGEVLTYEWDFGDGTLPVSGVDLTAPVHTYGDDGEYTVGLLVTDIEGASSYDEMQVIVNNVPPVITSVTNDSPRDEGWTVMFDATFTDPGWLDTHTATWDFGDGGTGVGPLTGAVTEENEYPDATGTVSITHTYGDNGTYTATLTLIDDDGDVDVKTTTVVIHNVAPSVTSIGTDSPRNEGSVLTFNATFTDFGWLDTHSATIDFGDGTQVVSGTVTEEHDAPDATGAIAATHTYGDNGTYTVTLTVRDDDGGRDTKTTTVTINNVAPTAKAGPDQTANEGDTVQFAGSHTDPGWLDTHTYSWNFGDASTGEGINPTHAYGDNGTYTVTVTVTDDDGGIGTDTLKVTVNNVAPSITSISTDSPRDEGSVLTFNASFTDPGWLDTHSATVDFGDGTPAVSGTVTEEHGAPDATGTIAATHTYGDNGTYSVTLTVRDDDGGRDTKTTTVTINNVPPTAEAGPDQTVDEGDTVQFAGSHTDPGWLDTHTYSWSFGDDSTGEGINPTHAYGDNGTYTVTLTVTDDDGGVGTDTLKVTVNNVAPTVDAGTDETVDENSPVTFSGGFTDPGWLDTHEATWDFGDGTDPVAGTIVKKGDSAPEVFGSHTYEWPGVYTVTLGVEDDDGGEGIDTLIVTVQDAAAPNVELMSPSPENSGICQIVNGVVTIIGIANDIHPEGTHPVVPTPDNFSWYKIEYAEGKEATSGWKSVTDEVQTESITEPTALASWDTAELSSGYYTLKLTASEVTKEDGTTKPNISEFTTTVYVGEPELLFEFGEEELNKPAYLDLVELPDDDGPDMLYIPDGKMGRFEVVVEDEEDIILVTDRNDDTIAFYITDGTQEGTEYLGDIFTTHLKGKGKGKGSDENKPEGIAIELIKLEEAEHKYEINIYLADRNNDRVLKITPDEVVQIGSRVEFNKPTGIILGGDGRIYITDRNNDRLIILNANGSLFKEINVGFDKPTGIDVVNFVDDQGELVDVEIYITDRNNDRLLKLDADGQITMTIGGLGTEPGQFDKPMGVYVNDRGYICVTDRNNDRVQKFDEYGNFIMQFGGLRDGLGLFNKPIGITLSNKGQILYVVDQNNDRVCVFGLPER